MVIEILSYSNSVFNPLLKIIITGAFGITAILLYQCRISYGGILQKVATFLLLGAIFGTIASVFRFQGDFYTQYKWGESILDLILVITTLIIAMIIRKKMNETVNLFETPDENK